MRRRPLRSWRACMADPGGTDSTCTRAPRRLRLPTARSQMRPRRVQASADSDGVARA